MPRYSISSSSSSCSPSKSPPLRSPTKPRRRRRRQRDEPSATPSSSATSARSSSKSETPPVKRRSKKPRSQKSQSEAKKEDIERTLHSILLCNHEKTEARLVTSLRGKKLMQYSKAIGQVADPVTKKGSEKHPELQNLGFSVLRGIEKFIRLLHQKKYTLEGKLNVKMLYWIQSSKSVKLHKDSIPDLTSYSDEKGKMDYSSIGVIIRDKLFGAKGLNPPADVLAWIDLMLADPLKDKYLIRYNVALLYPRAKLDVFSACYEKLLQLKELVKLENEKKPRVKLDSEKKTQYYQVVNNIIESDPGCIWMTSVYDNLYVEEVYEKNREGRYNTPFELLRFIRDSIHHLTDYSVKDGIVIFTLDDKYLMIESCFPGVLHKFQKAMADAGMKEGEHLCMW